MSYEEKKYVGRMTCIKGAFKGALAREAKGMSKPACYLEFSTAEGIVSARVSNPMKAQDYYKVAKFLGALGKPVMIEDLAKAGQTKVLTGLTKLEGEELMLVVTPFEYKGKTYFSVTDFADKKYDTGIDPGPSHGGQDEDDAPLPF